MKVVFAPTVPPPEGAVVANQAGYTGDTIYLSQDGHYIGDDGFVVPKNFIEFYGRFPNMVRNWVKKRLSTQPDNEVEDWTQDLLIHLQSLPEDSKHRDAGKTDLVQVFDPFRQYGASERRFRHFLNVCLMRKFLTVGSKFSRNPLSRMDNVSLSAAEQDEFIMQSGGVDEYVYKNSTELSLGTDKEFKAQDDQMFTGEFIDFVVDRDPEVAPLLTAVLRSGGSFADTRRFWCSTCDRLATEKEVQSGLHSGHQLGIDQKEFNRFRGRLKELAGQFVREE